MSVEKPTSKEDEDTSLTVEDVSAQDMTAGT
jgi:hypothetical protein